MIRITFQRTRFYSGQSCMVSQNGATRKEAGPYTGQLETTTLAQPFHGKTRLWEIGYPIP
jgi:hypothetical protein